MSTLNDKLSNLQQKAKERTVKTITIEYDLETLVKKIKKNVIMLNPEYQRNHRWDDKTSSRLIESLILNIPVPVIYISQDVDVDSEVDDGVPRYSVIDGQQRLTAIYNYISNKFRLVGLETLEELNGSLYQELPPFLTRRLEERTIKCLRIDSTIDSQVKYDIFERLNSGSVVLTAQELRNATYRGRFNKLLKRLAANKEFKELTGLRNPKNVKVKQMFDRELVLRFFALTYKDGFKDYKGGFKKFLDGKMELFSDLSEESINEFESIFNLTFSLIKTTFGDTPFSKYRYESEKGWVHMSNFNLAVFDSAVVPFYKIALKKDLPLIRYDDFKELFKDNEYFQSIEGSTNDIKKLKTRVIKSLEKFGL